MTDLSALDATAQAALVRSGEASPLELVDAAITRIEKLDPELNAVIHPRFERAREEAARDDLPDGPFRGVPVLFKDLCCAMEGEPYHEGMKMLRDAGYVSPVTDNLARQYLAAGFVNVGRTNTPELGLVPTTEPEAYGPTHNPWKLGFTTGGSSGGSAAAVASGMTPVAHANDGGGSIRIPAACCGLVGLKPTRGRTSIGPSLGEIANFLQVDLCVSRTVRDTAGVLQAVQGRFPGDPMSAPPPTRSYLDELTTDPGGLRIGILTEDALTGTPVHPDCVAGAEGAGRLLESLGHHVEVSHPAAFASAELLGHFASVWAASCAHDVAEHARWIGKEPGPDDVEPLTWAFVEMADGVTAIDLIVAVNAAQRYARDVAEWWQPTAAGGSGFDLLLSPTLGEPPVPHGTFAAAPDNPLAGFFRAAAFVPNTAQANVTGQPAISLPLHWNADGLPIGVQLMADYGREDLLLRVAAQLEAAAPWADRRPPVFA
jgi:amidase